MSPQGNLLTALSIFKPLRDLTMFLSIFLEVFLICIASRRGQAGCYQHTIIYIAAGPVVLEKLCNVIDANEKITRLQLKSEIAK
jgi:hypothetical protein